MLWWFSYTIIDNCDAAGYNWSNFWEQGAQVAVTSDGTTSKT